MDLSSYTQKLEHRIKPKRPIKPFQAVGDEIHALFGLIRREPYIYALASQFKNPRDLYDLAKSEVWERGLRGRSAFRYLLGILKVK